MGGREGGREGGRDSEGAGEGPPTHTHTSFPRPTTTHLRWRWWRRRAKTRLEPRRSCLPPRPASGHRCPQQRTARTSAETAARRRLRGLRLAAASRACLPGPSSFQVPCRFSVQKLSQSPCSRLGSVTSQFRRAASAAEPGGIPVPVLFRWGLRGHWGPRGY